MAISAANGGTMEMTTAGSLVSTFQIMSNELSTPKILLCPADRDRTVASNFQANLSVRHISYFVGLDANTNSPLVFLSGDGNFEIGGLPVKPGLLEFSTKTPLAWTTARHNRAGNIGLADGSVRLLNNSDLTNQLHQTGLATNRLAIP
jgi:prepilin-type processing-associated H-X9-DG protein